MADSIEGTEWKTIELSKLLEETEAFRDFKDALESVKEKLNSAVDFLDALETLLNILSAFENILNDFFNGFLGAFLEEVKKIIQEAKSTGIYALDLTTHNYIGNKFINIDENGYSGDPLIDDYIRNDLTFPYWVKEFGGTEPLETNMTKKWWTRWMGIYKRQTYRDWINVAISAFLDENDKADPTLSSLYLSKWRGQASSVKNSNQEKSDAFMIPPNALKYIRPGRPDFGPRGYIRCWVVAITAPDFVGFIQLLGLFSYFLGSSLGRQKRHLDSLVEKMKQDTTDFLDFRDIQKFFKDNLTPPTSRGEPPDFIGISAYQLLPELFDGLERIIDALRALFEKTSSGLAKYIKDIIEFLRAEIQEIRMFIQLIQEIVDFIDRLLEFNGALLDVEAYGTSGLVEAITNARGFPIPEDQKAYIGGGLFCFGYPTDKDNPGSFDLGRYWKDGWQRFKEKTVSYGDGVEGASQDSDFDYIKSLFGKFT